MSSTTTQPVAVGVDLWLASFVERLATGDAAGVAELFAPKSFWRDLVAFTWNVKTVEGPAAVRDMLEHTLATAKPRGWRVVGDPIETGGVSEAWLEFETEVGRGTGHVRLIDGQAFTLLTALDELKDHEESVGMRRPKGVAHGSDPKRHTWLEERRREAEELGRTTQPYVVIVGGGQAGIALGARLRQLRVPSIIVEHNARPGDSWRRRYPSLCLHDPVWYDHLPYVKFPPNWPVFSPKDKIADWLEVYTRVMELNYWGSTTALRASYDEATGEWDLVVEREGKEMTLRPKQLVMATGISGRPRTPRFPGAERFRGDQHHSSAHPGPEAYRGKRAVVIGSNSSAHDICAALWEHGADVTMVQRSSTHVVRSETMMELALSPLYSEEAVAAGMSTEKADMTMASTPYRIMAGLQVPLYEEIRERDADFYARLEKSGFQHDWGEDNSGLFMKFLRRAGGFYIDVGASELIISGEIKLQPGEVDHLTEEAVFMSDGTELPADVVVYATGYESMSGTLSELISPEVADRVGKVWGLGSGTARDPGPWEGEERNMWKPTQQPGLWFHGGNLHQARHYSLYLSLQLKARAEGIDTPVYGLQEVHHTS